MSTQQLLGTAYYCLTLGQDETNGLVVALIALVRSVILPLFVCLYCTFSEGQEVLVNDGRPNGELLLSTGSLQDNNLSDCIYFPASLVPADR